MQGSLNQGGDRNVCGLKGMFQLFVFWTAIDACLVGVLLPSSGTVGVSARLLPLPLLIKLWNIFMSPNINYSFTQEVLPFFLIVIQQVIHLFYLSFAMSLYSSCLYL